MKQYIKDLVSKYYGIEPSNIDDLGGGFYGKVYLAEINEEPCKLVIKVYLKDDLAVKECRQIEMLAQCATLEMPKIYLLHHKDGEIPYDAVFMSYVDGINAGIQSSVEEHSRARIADQIVDNLIAYHSNVNEQGFGEVDGDTFFMDWRDYYRPMAACVVDKAKELSATKLNRDVYNTVKKAYENYDAIFCIPITEACLIHGDYNMWNIMLNDDKTNAVAVIDPFNCCWGDPEFDLYQLTNVNGNDFGLLELYKSKRNLSVNFEVKNVFYQLFTEINHYYDAGVDPDNQDLLNIADKLKVYMKSLT